MATDKLIYGTTRPLLRIGTDRWVLNQPPSFHDIKFPKQIILNESWDGELFEHILGYRGIFTINWELLDRPSVEILIDILNSSSDKYMRPHFNFWKEYKIRCMHGFELDRFGKVNQPYKGTLVFETIKLENSIPLESSGSFYLGDEDTWYTGALTDNLTGDVSIEFWVRWQDPLSGKAILWLSDVDPPQGCNWQIDTEGQGRLSFITGPTGNMHHMMTPIGTFVENIWYHIVCKRIDTDHKYIIVNGVSIVDEDDLKSVNNLTSLKVGHTTAAFDGHIQIVRAYDQDITEYNKCAIEAIPSSYITNLKIWIDFSSGLGTDLSGNDNDVTLTGNSNFAEYSFPDKGYEILT